ncbi:MAG TPA: NUDIX hydrolase [Lysobacter sp.]
MKQQSMPDKAGLDASFPKKRISAGAVIRSSSGELLIVKPTYREGWLLPGGVCESNESPAMALVREIDEELGLVCGIVKLLCVDYLSPADGFSEALHFLFECKPLSADDIANIRIDTTEIADYRFCRDEEACVQLVPAIARRLTFLESGGNYCENGLPATTLG